MAAYSKVIVALLGAALTFLNQQFGLDIGVDAEQLMQWAIPVLTALGVWAVPNRA